MTLIFRESFAKAVTFQERMKMKYMKKLRSYVHIHRKEVPSRGSRLGLLSLLDNQKGDVLLERRKLGDKWLDRWQDSHICRTLGTLKVWEISL